MTQKNIDHALQDWMDHQELSGGALLVRRRDEVVYQKYFGFADMKLRKPIAEDSIYRMMSLTKVVVAVAVMKLVEDGRLALDEPISTWLPAFRHPRVVDDPRYVFHGMPGKLALAKTLLLFNKDRVKTVPAERELTLRDLLSHSSGLEMGVYGFLRMMKNPIHRKTTAQVAEAYAAYPLDFQPGTDTGYSALAGFDVLLRICEVVSGLDAKAFMKQTLFDPLDMEDATFDLTAGQEARLVRLYQKKKDALIDVTGSKKDTRGFIHAEPGYPCGSGGLYATARDYDRLAQMLCNEGSGYLKPETVRLVATEAPALHLEPEPGMVWGLGVRVRQDGQKGGFKATPGTFGWSGAFGTHLFVSPKDHLSAVFCTNRSDAGGSGFFISRKLENMIFEIFAEK